MEIPHLLFSLFLVKNSHETVRNVFMRVSQGINDRFGCGQEAHWEFSLRISGLREFTHEHSWVSSWGVIFREEIGPLFSHEDLMRLFFKTSWASSWNPRENWFLMQNPHEQTHEVLVKNWIPREKSGPTDFLVKADSSWGSEIPRENPHGECFKFGKNSGHEFTGSWVPHDEKIPRNFFFCKGTLTVAWLPAECPYNPPLQVKSCLPSDSAGHFFSPSPLSFLFYLIDNPHLFPDFPPSSSQHVTRV